MVLPRLDGTSLDPVYLASVARSGAVLGEGARAFTWFAVGGLITRFSSAV